MTSPNPPRPTVAEVLDKLAAHGSARQVADHLAAEGITGFQCLSAVCPVSNWVHRQTGQRIMIGRATWDLDGIDGHIPDAGDTPDVVGAFIAAFDKGDFPELDFERRRA